MDEFVERRNSQPPAEPMIRWFQAYSNGAMTAGDEIRRFARDQVQRNLNVWTAMMDGPQKLVEAHEKWVTDTFQDCVTESQRLMSIGGEMLTTVLHQDGLVIHSMSDHKR